MGDALLRHAGKVIHPVHRIEGGNGIHPQGVDGALDQELAHRLAGLLQGCDRTVLQGHFQQAPVHVEIPGPKLQIGDVPVHIPDGQSCGHCLRDDRSHRRADDAKPQSANEDQVQDTVEHGGKHQEFQRCLRIAHTF